ncbi:hypothetical protein [Coprothermobacter platensis]|uniref:hypothetical protein n=1 Tax=Coprothermobacter platensis TaxID=108819 RepID=UPI00035DCDD9|nr:hypothetical protein [Coprothermobacter platensis]
MEEVKRTLRIVWMTQEGKKRLWSLNNIDPAASTGSILALVDAMGTLTNRVTNGVQLMVVSNVLP